MLEMMCIEDGESKTKMGCLYADANVKRGACEERDDVKKQVDRSIRRVYGIRSIYFT